MAELNPIAKKEILHQIEGAARVAVRRDVEFAEGLTMDVYESGLDSAPVVVIVSGYRDEGFQRFVGCRFKDAAFAVSWAKSIAASGMTAIAYTNREPLNDLGRVLQFIRKSASSLNLDAARIGLFATSGHAPVALSAMTAESSAWLRCVAIAYGYLLDAAGSTDVADAAKQFGFAVPPVTIRDLARDIPLLIARAGRDEMPHLNEVLDGFVAEALTANLPLTLFNHPTGPHAFDLFDDSPTTAIAIETMLTFLRLNLRERSGG